MTPQEHMTQTLDFVQKSLGDKALPQVQSPEDSGAAVTQADVDAAHERTMQAQEAYDDIVSKTLIELATRMEKAEAEIITLKTTVDRLEAVSPSIR